MNQYLQKDDLDEALAKFQRIACTSIARLGGCYLFANFLGEFMVQSGSGENADTTYQGPDQSEAQREYNQLSYNLHRQNDRRATPVVCDDRVLNDVENEVFTPRWWKESPDYGLRMYEGDMGRFKVSRRHTTYYLGWNEIDALNAYHKQRDA